MPTWNFLVYAIAADDDNGLLQGRMQAALAAMEKALTAGTNRIGFELITKGANTCTWVTPNAQPVVTSNASSGLVDFLDASVENLPKADCTALVLWAHGSATDAQYGIVKKLGVWPPVPPVGSGWNPSSPWAPSSESMGPYPGTKTYLTTVGVRNAIAGSKLQRVDLLGFDACCMASLENAYELRNVASVQLASQLQTHDWPYGVIASILAQPVSLDANTLAQQMVGAIKTAFVSSSLQDSVAAIVSQPLAALVGAVNACGTTLSGLLPAQGSQLVKEDVDDINHPGDPNYADLGDLLAKLGSSPGSTPGAAAAALLPGVILKLEASPLLDAPVCGLSILCPQAPIDVTAAYAGTDFANTPWSQFLVAFAPYLKSQSTVLEHAGALPLLKRVTDAVSSSPGSAVGVIRRYVRALVERLQARPPS